MSTFICESKLWHGKRPVLVWESCIRFSPSWGAIVLLLLDCLLTYKLQRASVSPEFWLSQGLQSNWAHPRGHGCCLSGATKVVKLKRPIVTVSMMRKDMLQIYSIYKRLILTDTVNIHMKNIKEGKHSAVRCNLVQALHAPVEMFPFSLSGQESRLGDRKWRCRGCRKDGLQISPIHQEGSGG